MTALSDSGAPLLQVRGLVKQFPIRRSGGEMLRRAPRRSVHALRGVSLDVAQGEIVGLVGESGCGKSTMARCLSGLTAPDGGEVLWGGTPLSGVGLERARKIQMVFQDPYASLNPRMTLSQTLEEVLRVHGRASGRGECGDLIDELLLTVGLAPRLKHRLPHAISGGQRQRVSIARALAVRPEVLIADEPVSALDASIQAQIINLLEDLRRTLGISIIFVSHDLNVIRHISDRVAVMYLGQVVELADTEDLFARPSHPYTRALLDAIPKPDPDARSSAPALVGELPDPTQPPPGCAFSSRCPWVVPACREAVPGLMAQHDGRQVRCSNDAALAAAPLIRL